MNSTYLNQINSSYNICSDFIFKNLAPNMTAITYLEGEDTLYVRFNNLRVRQNTEVEQGTMTMTLFTKHKSIKNEYCLTGKERIDLLNTKIILRKAIDSLNHSLEENSSYQISPHVTESKTEFKAFYNKEDIIAAIFQDAYSFDFNGIVHFGPIIRAARNSYGSRHFFSTDFFNLDYSLFLGNKSIKSLYCGFEWDQKKFNKNFITHKQNLKSLAKTTISLSPNKYRVYLAPTAVNELAQMLSWRAASQKAYRQGNSPFKKLIENHVKLSKHITIKENKTLGLSTPFSTLAERSMEQMIFVENGQFLELFTSTKTANEYQLKSNFADSNEAFQSLEISPGLLEEKEILKSLDTGLFISNLHYLNWSNESEARITGMTRNGCFWVKDGVIQGPIQDLRFDDSFYHLWGDGLESITNFQELEFDTNTYDKRHLGGKKTPGMIINEMNFTL
ncbi:MAG: metallopeptidase TldD-related protein [Bdellovibrionaceae bacterium]|nr:metallopeptidase TldD-related protein [Pseudobdellovibrionaceae bacterium]NUM59148.1 Zn-dependent protease [Pseudobdellovibrionaceae bacterium]